MSSNVPESLRASVEGTKVDYVPLGKTGLRVSNPILGGMSFGHKAWAEWNLEDDEAMDLLKGAWERGLNTWDTANIYSNGASEEIIGKALKKFNIPRQKIIILTKCFGVVGEEPGLRGFAHQEDIKKSKDYVNQYGLSRGAIFKAVNASLKRLDTDYIDLLQIHRYDTNVPPEETMKALHDLVQSGKVHYIGASSMWAYQLARLNYVAEKSGWTKFVSMQNHYSLVYREEEREMNKFCTEEGIGLIPWGPLFAGHLARPLGVKTTRSSGDNNLTEADQTIIKRVEELANKKGWKMSQVALVWIVQKGTIPIVGFSSLERMDEACEIRGKSLTDEEMKYLEEPYVARKVIGHG